MRSLVQEWLNDIYLQQQTAVLTCLRGCDGQSNKDLSKNLVKKIRSVTLNCVDSANSKEDFITDNISLDDVSLIGKDCDKYPVHFYMHLCFACEIIGYKHPDSSIREFFFNSYCILVKAIHLNIETEKECDERLKD